MIILYLFIIYRLFCWICLLFIKSVEPMKKDEIYYCCYKKKKNIGMWLRSMCGLPVCSSALIVNNHIYRFKKDKEYMQKEVYTLDYIKKRYLVLDTGYTIYDLNNKREIEEKRLLLQKRKNSNSNILKNFNCLKATSIVLNQLNGFVVPSWCRFTSVYTLILFIKGKYWGQNNAERRRSGFERASTKTN